MPISDRTATKNDEPSQNPAFVLHRAWNMQQANALMMLRIPFLTT